MVNPLTALFAGSTAISLYSQKKAKDRRDELEQQLKQRRNEQMGESDSDFDGEVSLSDPDRELQMEQHDALERLVDIQERTGPTPESRDATQDGTFQLDPGDAAVIEAQPENGYELRVNRVYVDRRDDHSYNIAIDGIDVSSIHEWEGNPPRTVTENGKVKVEVVNESSSSTEMDFVIDMFGMESGSR